MSFRLAPLASFSNHVLGGMYDVDMFVRPSRHRDDDAVCELFVVAAAAA